MAKKTEGLSYPTDPLRAIRELQDLDNPPPAIPKPETRPEPVAIASVAPLPAMPATESEDSSATSSAVADAAKPKRIRAVQQPEKEEEPTDPLAVAVRDLLGKPYSANSDKGPFTVSTVKIPSEVWERLGWVSKLIGRTKQDIISEALKGYFRTVAKDI